MINPIRQSVMRGIIGKVIKRLEQLMAKHKNWHGASRKRLLKKKLKSQKQK
jgi:hypothetical protein